MRMGGATTSLVEVLVEEGLMRSRMGKVRVVWALVTLALCLAIVDAATMSASVVAVRTAA